MLEYLTNHPWTSVHGTVNQNAVRIAYPKNLDANGVPPTSDPWRAGLDALLQLVGDAKAANATLLPMGSAWSLSDVLRASPTGWRVVTTYLNHIPFIGLKPSHMATGSTFTRQRLVFAQAGCTVLRVLEALVPHGLTVPTMGSSCGQTLGGCLSTGTHGSAVNYGPMPTMVRGIHLVTNENKSVWLEPKTHPAVSDAFCKHLNATPIRDDDRFNAALVAFGTMGIVHGYLLEVEPLFLLRRTFRGSNLATLAGKIGRNNGVFQIDASVVAPDSPDTLYHFEIVCDPNDLDDDVVLNVMHRVGSNVGAYFWRPDAAVTRSIGDDALHDIGRLPPWLGIVSNGLIRRKVRDLFAELYPLDPPNVKVGILPEMFSRNEVPQGGHSADIGVDANNWLAAFKSVLRVIRGRTRAHAGLVSARFVPASEATLAFTAFPVTCAIELPAVNEAETLQLYRDIWKALQDDGIAYTLHWGQACEFGVRHVTAMYGASRVQAWRAARNALLGPTERPIFRNALYDLSGL